MHAYMHAMGTEHANDDDQHNGENGEQNQQWPAQPRDAQTTNTHAYIVPIRTRTQSNTNTTMERRNPNADATML